MTQHDGARVSIDKECRAVYLAQIDVAKAARKAALDAGMTRALIELVNIRISQINGCAYCLDTHISAALRYGEDAQRIAVLPAWRDTTLFSAKERAAVSWIAITINAFNRISIVSRHAVQPVVERKRDGQHATWNEPIR